MSFYLVGTPPQYDYPNVKATLRTGRPWGLPGLDCPRCGAWSSGVFHPDLVLPPEFDDGEYTFPRAEGKAVVDALRDRLLPYLPLKSLLLPPGTRFGPLVGDISDMPADLLLLSGTGTGALLTRARTFAQLTKRLPGLHAVRTYLRISAPDSCGPHHAGLVEVVARPTARAIGVPPPEALECSLCGLVSNYEPRGSIDVDPNSLEPDQHLFRFAFAPRRLLCTHRFRDAVDELGLTGITFGPVFWRARVRAVRSPEEEEKFARFRDSALAAMKAVAAKRKAEVPEHSGSEDPSEDDEGT